ncbi:MAG: energy-coupling factor transporter transmembrane component T [Clostridia bacterium]|nr:energy-coupling factor transporter transmembrane component T [Clostridia bacterium]
MFKDITIGQYIAGDSFLHKMDARVKILLTVAVIILLFMISNPIAYIIFIAFSVFLVILSKIPPMYVLKGLRPMLFIIVFTVFINLFLTPGEPLWQHKILFGWTLKITYEGVRMSVLMFLRLTLLVGVTSLLTLTTSPLMLTDGIEKILKPFEVIKVPSHEIAMMMSIAIRFIPTLAEETDKIIKAQTARGADFDSGNIIAKAKAMIPLLVPLFVSAFRRADELATAMDARCYNGGKNRTRMKQMKMGSRDYTAIGAMAVFAVVLAAAQYFI